MNKEKDNSEIYNRDFYEGRNDKTRYSAQKIIKVVKKYFSVHSVVDFGCGVGTWLSVAKEEFGDIDVLGLDGDYVQRELLQIEETNFLPTDLSLSVSTPKRYDLAISLEVAEHLPQTRAEGFVRDLCSSSDLILFSAATAQQGGDGHVNERRLSYWVDLFERQGYQLLDLVRPEVWDDDSVLVWYKQNTVVFVNKDKYDINSFKYGSVIDIIHPDIFEQRSKIALHPITRFMYNVRAFLVNLGK